MIGSGPNGLAAAVAIAQAGHSVLVLEGHGRIGGGTRSAELTLPGFVHDVCAAVHPLAAASPAFATMDLERHGLEWVHPEIPLAHPLEGGRAAVLHRSLDRTVDGLGRDGRRWRQLVGSFVEHWDQLAPSVMGPIIALPRHPLALAGFGARALLPATLVRRAFRTAEAAALFGGCAAHAFLPLDHPLTTAFGITLAGSGHRVGWPFAKGGSQAVADALAARLAELGGEIRTGSWVRSMRDLPAHRVALFDTNPAQLAEIAGDELSERSRRRLRRFRHGPAAFKVDYALAGPVPWANHDCRRAGTVHVGGTFAEVRDAEAAVAAGRTSARPFVLVAQPSVVDPTRAPAGGHTLWAYAHVPHGCTADVTSELEAQIERFAPGFRDLVLARHTTSPADFERYNPNYVGGDIGGGSHDGAQLLFRPTIGMHAYRTANPRLFLCSASTPPGGGVHGMSGWNAAQQALNRLRR